MTPPPGEEPRQPRNRPWLPHLRTSPQPEAPAASPEAGSSVPMGRSTSRSLPPLWPWWLSSGSVERRSAARSHSDAELLVPPSTSQPSLTPPPSGSTVASSRCSPSKTGQPHCCWLTLNLNAWWWWGGGGRRWGRGGEVVAVAVVGCVVGCGAVRCGAVRCGAVWCGVVFSFLSAGEGRTVRKESCTATKVHALLCSVFAYPAPPS